MKNLTSNFKFEDITKLSEDLLFFFRYYLLIYFVIRALFDTKEVTGAQGHMLRGRAYSLYSTLINW